MIYFQLVTNENRSKNGRFRLEKGGARGGSCKVVANLLILMGPQRGR